MDKIIELKSKLSKFIKNKDKNYNENIKNNAIISKTVNSIILNKLNKSYCINNFKSKTYYISYENIYYNDFFHVFINKNIITLIDEDLVKTQIFIPIQIKKIYVKKSYIILYDNKNVILINNKNIFVFKNYEIIEIDEYTLLIGDNVCKIINENGFVENKDIDSKKANLFYEKLKKLNGIDEFVNLIAQ